MNESEFLRQKEAALENMRKMNSQIKSARNNSANQNEDNFQKRNGSSNEFHSDNRNNRNGKRTNTPVEGFDLSGGFFRSGSGLNFLNRFSSDGDITLLLGLLLILISEGADKKLLFALFYILL